MSSFITEKITLKEACELLKISRPTFNKWRKKYRFKEIKRGRQYFFSRKELIQKVLFPNPPINQSSNLILDACDIDELEVDSNVFDLRSISIVDAFGAMSLLCLLKKRLHDSENAVYVIVKDSPSCIYLKAIGFFDELKRGATKLFINDEDIPATTALPPENILRLSTIGYKGAEKKILEQLYISLQMQGFSENLCSYLGWSLGELADNAHTHAGGPCFITIVSMSGNAKSAKFLCVSIGDIGNGICESLKQNNKYKNLSDLEALYCSFKSSVTSWDDTANRGKGLNDLLAIGKGNRAWLRVESNGLSLFFNFGEDPIQIKSGKASTKTVGTRFSLVLIDSNFDDVSKQEIDNMIDEEMKALV